MANRHSRLSAIGFLGILAAAGCQSHPATTTTAASVTDGYAQPRFDEPRAAVTTAAAPLPAVTPPASAPAAKPLARVVAAIKPKVQSFKSYLTGVPVAWVPPVAPRPWRWIVVHHSDTEHGDAAYIDKLHKGNGWDGLGYDFVIGNGTDSSGDGNVEVGYRWRQQSIGAHAKTPDNRFNEYGIGICLVGDMMKHPPTPKQLAAVERLSAYLMATYHIAPDHILGHGDTKATDCPGRYTNLTLIRRTATREAGGAAAIAGTNYGHPTGEMLVQATRAK